MKDENHPYLWVYVCRIRLEIYWLRKMAGVVGSSLRSMTSQTMARLTIADMNSHLLSPCLC